MPEELAKRYPKARPTHGVRLHALGVAQGPSRGGLGARSAVHAFGSCMHSASFAFWAIGGPFGLFGPFKLGILTGPVLAAPVVLAAILSPDVL